MEDRVHHRDKPTGKKSKAVDANHFEDLGGLGVKRGRRTVCWI